MEECTTTRTRTMRTDDPNGRQQILEVMDFLEEETDGHTCDDLIPLQLRMALEDQVFGWNHFLSNILGHVAYTLGSYLITFWIITFVVLREVPWGGHHADNAGSCASDDGCQSGGDNRPWGMPHTTFSLLRTCISLASAVSTFRTIRRRRRVWLRHPLDGAELSNFEAQRRASSLEVADAHAQRIVLGNRLFSRMQDSYARRRDRYLSRRVSKKLLKAHRMFERRHRNRVEQIRRAGSSGSLVELGERERNESADSAHERMRMLASPPASVTRKRHRRQRTAPGGSSILPAASADSASLGDDDTVGSAASLEDDGRSGLGSFVPGAVMDSNTLPNFAIESVGHDQMPFSHGEIRRVPYVHGGFFGAAPFMLTNPHWIAILRLLMPDVYVEISRRASYAPAPKLIHWAENNPVVAAYGAAHEIEFSGAIPTLEWDVFLDPHLVWRLEIVLNEKESFLQRQKDAKEQQAQELDAADPGEAEKTSEEAGQSAGPAHTASAPVCPTEERLLLSYYDKEIKRRTKLLVDRMLIAHGNVPQLMIEQTGYLKKYNFSRVKRTRKTLGGGIYARMWLAVFSEAMKLGLGFDDEDEAAMGNEGGDGYDGGESSEDGNSLRSVDEGGFREALPTNSSHSMDDDDDQNPAGPPRKIYMVRNDTDEEGNSTDDGSLSQTSPQKHTGQGDRKSRRKMKKRKRLEKKKKRWNITSLKNASVVADKSIFESIDILKKIMRERYPVRLLLDMKSRHVSRRVWASVVDCLRESGARVEGVASFFVEEVRDISQYCNTRVNEIIFAHSAGDMQQLCHKGAIKRGDKVFFNAGSLLWDYPDLSDSSVVGDILWHRLHPYFDKQEIKEGYRFKPYARIKSRGGSSSSRSQHRSESVTCDDSTLWDEESITSKSLFTKLMVSDRKRRSLCEIDFAFEELPPGVTCSTIQEYKEHHQLSLGLYVQEFAIDEVAISLLVRYVNTLGREVFDLGLSWGGINGLTVKGIQPGRFTATEGFWIQRYTGMPWIRKLKPGSAA
mmetsp:Transcript_26181/g.62210  ORF Transcript_26181/g.62210 Transcript_26181/m.62210 type:complete len:1015 (+) Transcript_26181:173-3217(+)